MKRLIMILLLLTCSIFAIGDTMEVSMENDVMARTDRHYTHGTKISYSYPIESVLFADKNVTRIWSIGQYMYTPSKINLETIQYKDRPYAGWLYGSTSVSVCDDNNLDLIEFSVGVTGDWSGAGDTQKLIHKWIDSQDPKGWDTQLDSIVGLNLTFVEKYKWKIDNYADIMVKGNMTVGNIHVNAGLGASLRLGYNIPDDFGIIRMEPTSRDPSQFGVYSIVEVAGRAVGYNHFIEGENADKVYGIHAERLVADLDIGCGVYYGKVNFIYLYNIRSKEFKEQKDHNEFGTAAISWGW